MSALVAPTPAAIASGSVAISPSVARGGIPGAAGSTTRPGATAVGPRRRRPGMVGSAANLALGLPVGLVLWAASALALIATVPLLGSRHRSAPINLLRSLQTFEAFRYATLIHADGLADARTPWRGLRDPGLWRFLTYSALRVPISLAHDVVLVLTVGLPLLAAINVGRAAVATLRMAGDSAYYLSVPPAVALILLVAPWFVPLVARADHWLAALLLGTQVLDLERRIGDLTDARRRTVDEAERERGRIERDLHDGAQQRLIALSILLGRTEQRLAAGQEAAALAGVRDAKAETLAVIAEIRGLTQGLRPAVLESRGLDAALSSVAARLDLPVAIDVHLTRRPGAAVEAALYFAIAELLTNTVKHAGARSARVEVTEFAGRLTATVSDDGCGGADSTRGSGLRGIADRLAGVDGSLRLSSPFGGPTVATLEVPCGS